MMTKNKIEIDEESGDREMDIRVNGKSVFYTNYDELGWSGMEAVKQAVTEVVKALGHRIGE